MIVDFVRFVPCIKLDFDNFVVFSERPEDIPENFLKGYLVKAENVKELVSKLRRAKKDWFVGVIGDPKILRSAVMRRRVDVILDFPERELDYVTVKMAKEKDVAIEISISKFLKAEGLRRLRLIEDTIDLLRIIRKFNTPFILTSGAYTTYELRPRRQIFEFFEMLGADIEKAEFWLSRLVRRYTDPNYIMDGLEVEQSL